LLTKPSFAEPMSARSPPAEGLYEINERRDRYDAWYNKQVQKEREYKKEISKEKEYKEEISKEEVNKEEIYNIVARSLFWVIDWWNVS
jgi:hypothetical protein